MLLLCVCHYSFISFLLIVTDVNDNHPQFVGTNGSALTNMSYGITISEVCKYYDVPSYMYMFITLH